MSTELGPYPAYRDSGVEWLGRVPEHWDTRRLRTVLAGVTKRNRSDLPLLSVVREKGVILRDVSDSSGNHNYIPDDLSNYKLVRRGWFAINKMKAWQGSFGVSAEDGIVSPAYHIYKVSEVETDFFHVAIRSRAYVPYFSAASDGVRIGQWDLSATRMRAIPFVVPTKPEQSRIARFLEAADRRIRRYIHAKERLVELLEERKRALIHEAVTGRIDVRTGQPYPAYKDSGVEWLGNVPEHWELRRVKHAVRTSSKGIQIGPFGSSLTQLRHEDTGYKLYGQEHTISGDFRRGSRWITQEQFRQLRRYELLANDVVLTRKGSLGKCRLVPRGLKRGIMDSDTIRVRLDPTIVDQEFMVLLLHRATYLQSQIESVQRGAVLRGLNSSTIANLLTALPPIGEQRKIKARIGAFLDRIGSASDAVDRQIALLREYRTRLIADVVTGKLDVREAGADRPETDPLTRNRHRAETIDTESSLHSTANEIAKEANA